MQHSENDNQLRSWRPMPGVSRMEKALGEARDPTALLRERRFDEPSHPALRSQQIKLGNSGAAGTHWQRPRYAHDAAGDKL